MVHVVTPLRLVCCLAALSVAAPFAANGADFPYRRISPRIVDLPPTEARGCYYYRGREHCGSYCYWEINGKRYCQQRAREAFSQAGSPHESDVGDAYTLK